MGFYSDSQKGRQGEDILVKILESCGFQVKTWPGKYEFWDCCATLKDKTWCFEVKYDKYAAKSGNIALEFRNSKLDKPSGILVTRADFWVQILDKPLRVLVCPTDILIKLVKDVTAARPTKPKPLRIVYSKGDGNSDMVLFSLLEIESLFVDFNSMTKKEIKAWILK